MQAWRVGLWIVLALGAGFVIGRRTAGPPSDEAEDAASLRKERDAAKARADKAETELATSRDSKRRPREGVDLPKGAVAAESRAPFEEPKAAPAKPAMSDTALAEARKKRLNEIRSETRAYFENHEGEKALAALKELAALGPEARDDAMNLAIDINKDVNGAGELRLSMFTFYGSLGDPAVRDLMMWSLDNQASSKPDFRVISAYSVPWVMKTDEAIARFDTALSHEGDRAVQSAILDNLGSMKTPKADSLLSRVFGDTSRDPGLRADAAMALATSKDPVVQNALEAAAAGDAEPRIQTAAKLALVVRSPPATGCLVTRTTPDGNAEAAGIRPGDVITTYNGRPVASNEDLVHERDAVAASSVESVPVVVNRDGREQTIQVKPGRLGLPDVRSVTKK